MLVFDNSLFQYQNYKYALYFSFTFTHDQIISNNNSVFVSRLFVSRLLVNSALSVLTLNVLFSMCIVSLETCIVRGLVIICITLVCLSVKIMFLMLTGQGQSAN